MTSISDITGWSIYPTYINNIKEYLALLKQCKSRWDMLKKTAYDRHRRPEVPNSVLETWRISIERIREESEMSYRILHVIAYLSSQDIPYELIVASSQEGVEREDIKQTPKLEVQQAVLRLKEFSFLSMLQKKDSRRSYDMHKLVQEAVRYRLWAIQQMDMGTGQIINAEIGQRQSEAYYSKAAIQVMNNLFPITAW
jgi:hypothetical protein